MASVRRSSPRPTAVGHWLNSLSRWPRPTPRCTSARKFVILETAAIDAAATVAGTDRIQGVSSHVMFMARGKTGPFRVETEPMPGADGTVAVRTVMYDEGNGDRVTTVGSYLFRSALVRHSRHGCRNCPSEAGRQHRRRR